MAHEIIERQDMRLIGMCVDCPGFNISGIAPLWERFITRWNEIENAKGTWGISLPALDGFRYMAGMEVEATTVIPAGFESVTVPGGRYLKVPWHGLPKDMSAEFQRIFRDLMPSLGLSIKSGFHCLEEYLPEGHDETTGAMSTNLYVQLL